MIVYAYEHRMHFLRLQQPCPITFYIVLLFATKKDKNCELVLELKQSQGCQLHISTRIEREKAGCNYFLSAIFTLIYSTQFIQFILCCSVAGILKLAVYKLRIRTKITLKEVWTRLFKIYQIQTPSKCTVIRLSFLLPSLYISLYYTLQQTMKICN